MKIKVYKQYILFHVYISDSLMSRLSLLAPNNADLLSSLIKEQSVKDEAIKHDGEFLWCIL